jgi:hypothetical protein
VILYNHFMRRMTVILTETENHARSLRSAVADQMAAGDEQSHPAPKVLRRIA